VNIIQKQKMKLDIFHKLCDKSRIKLTKYGRIPYNLIYTTVDT
jgi:hypothetical protein